ARRFLLPLRFASSLLIKAATGQVLQREKGAAVVFAHLVDLDDVGVLQPCDGLRLPLEASPRRRVSVGARQDHFEGHRALERTLPSLVDNTHASPPQLRDDLVTWYHWQFRAGSDVAQGSVGRHFLVAGDDRTAGCRCAEQGSKGWGTA